MERAGCSICIVPPPQLAQDAGYCDELAAGESACTRDFDGVPDNRDVDHAPNIYRRHVDGRPSLTGALRTMAGPAACPTQSLMTRSGRVAAALCQDSSRGSAFARIWESAKEKWPPLAAPCVIAELGVAKGSHSTTSAAKGGGPPRRTIREIWAIMFGRHVSDWRGAYARSCDTYCCGSDALRSARCCVGADFNHP
jgi:hypothetical protein